MQIVLATQNKHKIEEIQPFFAALPIELILLSDFCTEEVEETGFTFIENALIKARFAAEKTGLPAIADDSGLVVPALNGEPGIYSARYAGKDKTNKDHLLKLVNNIQSIPPNNRYALMHCTMVFLRAPNDPSPLIAEADWEGEILAAPKGINGFGYDPVFWLPHENKTAAELSLDEKNKQSHRYQALKKLQQLMVEKLCMPCQSETL